MRQFAMSYGKGNRWIALSLHLMQVSEGEIKDTVLELLKQIEEGKVTLTIFSV